jgi:hypothetical protein
VFLCGSEYDRVHLHLSVVCCCVMHVRFTLAATASRARVSCGCMLQQGRVQSYVYHMGPVLLLPSRKQVTALLSAVKLLAV